MNSFDKNFSSFNEVYNYNDFSNQDQIEMRPLESMLEEESSTVINVLEDLNQVENILQEQQPNNEQNFTEEN